jgi:hypothetical protein
MLSARSQESLRLQERKEARRWLYSVLGAVAVAVA